MPKLMQRRQVEGYEMFTGMEQLEPFIETSKISCESPKKPKIQIKNLKSREVFPMKIHRKDSQTQKIFLTKDNKDRATTSIK